MMPIVQLYHEASSKDPCLLSEMFDVLLFKTLEKIPYLLGFAASLASVATK